MTASNSQIPQKSQFQFTLDGLSAFIDIANRAITEQHQQGRLNAADIDVLHGNMQAAMYNLGHALELLGAERIDYINTNDNQALCGGLLIAGGAIKSFASLNDTLQCARNRLAENPAKPAAPASQEWPCC